MAPSTPSSKKGSKARSSPVRLVVMAAMFIALFPILLIMMGYHMPITEQLNKQPVQITDKQDLDGIEISLSGSLSTNPMISPEKSSGNSFVATKVEYVKSSLNPRPSQSKRASSLNPSPSQPKRAQQPQSSGTGGGVHVIFSTDCSPFQNWQSIVSYYSAQAVGQPGPVTRIASGCSEEEKTALLAMHKHLSSQFRIHFTPDFSMDKKTGKKYLFFNKPHGLMHWQKYGVYNESVVALLDPDMLFIRPITGHFKDENVLTSPDWGTEKWDKVEKGRPAGQQYGLGARWLRFNREYICGEGSPCLTTSSSDANKFYPVGPPYILHVDDLKEMAETWVRFVPKIYEEYPQLLAEMYAYCMAAAHLNLKHFKIDNLMISNVDAGGEGWPWVDKFSKSSSCDQYRNGKMAYAVSTELDKDKPIYPGNLPSVLHFCQNYRQGEWMFGKRRVPKASRVTWPIEDGMLACDHPLLAHPPAENADVNYYPTNDGGTKTLNEKQRSRVSFSMNAAIEGINSALTRFKHDVCEPSTINLERTYKIIPEHVEKAKLKAAAAAAAKNKKR